MSIFSKLQKNQQDTNIEFAEGLPEMCYSVLPGPKQLICITRGADHFHFAGFRDANGDNARLADQLNREMGVSTAQRMAMEAGLIYGWNSPEADPQSYEPRREPQMGGLSL